ncbi:secondary thiamine-phosphate synthase enzyme YjbQ [Hansschlegelia beijingensis]|uniref:secondary thiamine-phosphate synthase enzyme YjbQ n=1 Tax=Hansschlegelia beijingensis TaxID=1133344 RepID=UPI00387F2A4D
MRRQSERAAVEEIRVGEAWHQALARLTVHTRGIGLVDITAAVASALEQAGAGDGLVTVFVRHTSCSLTVQENASPEVRDDLVDALEKLAPRDAGWRHDLEGPDDMPAHVKAMLTGVSVAVPVIDGRMALGVWQAIFLIEHRDRPHSREIAVHFIGARA